MAGGWNPHIRWTVGDSDNASPALIIDSFADSSVDIGLTAANPHDFASIDIDLGDIVNLVALGNGPVSGSFAASAAGTGTVVITNGNLSGSDTTSLSIDLTASLPAEHAAIHLHLTDDMKFRLTGSGYFGSTITQTAQSGGSAQAFSQTGTASQSEDDGNFDLARFVASVLNTNSVAVQFVASAPGESIHGEGSTMLKVDATADLPGDDARIRHLVFHETTSHHFAFNDTSSTAHMPHLVMVSST